MYLLVLLTVIVGITLLSRQKLGHRKHIFLFLMMTFLTVSFVSGCSSGQTKEKTSSASEKPTEKVEKTTEEVEKPQLESADSFTTTNDGTLEITGKTLPKAEVLLKISEKEQQRITSDEKGNYEFVVSNLPAENTMGTLTVTKNGEDTTKEITLTQSEGYKAKIAKEKTAYTDKVVAAQKNDQTQKPNKKEPSHQTKQRNINQPKKEALKENKQGEMVYITKTGKRYHYSQGCSGLNRSHGETKISKSQAEKQGYTRCKRE